MLKIIVGVMMKRIKHFLWSNWITRKPYRFLWECRHNGFRIAVNKALINVLNISKEKKVEKKDNDVEVYIFPKILRGIQKYEKTEIINIAFRRYNPDKGSTGGPGGVVAVLRECFGNKYNGFTMRYIFEKDIKYPENLVVSINNLVSILKLIFKATYFFEYYLKTIFKLNEYTNYLFICHDIGSAYGAYLQDFRYIVVYHSQGATIHERESFGEKTNEIDKKIAKEIEEAVFYNAEKVYFPSKGAKQSFIETTEIDCSRVQFADKPLYNTIINAPENLNGDLLMKKLNLLDIDRNSTDIFLSVGDWSINKGMDRVPEVLNKYCEVSHRNVYWIAIGSKYNSGVYENIKKNKDNWLFKSTLIGSRVNHNTILALMNYVDFYIMMQRHSIFDLATLEAMRARNVLVLSPVGGNHEFNKEDNVVFIKDESSIERLANIDKKSLGEKNKRVFEEYFSMECFYKTYGEMFNEHF